MITKTNPLDSRYKEYEHLATRAAKLWYKRYACTGSMTYDDFLQEARVGLINGLRHLETKTHANPSAYLASFAMGYITHAVHRTSRMVRPSYQQIKRGKALGHASLEHISMDPGYELPEPLETDVQEFLQSLTPRQLNRYNKTGSLPPQHQKTFRQLRAKYHG
jgi:DNA-directed RNA polymerase specialized sigma subunit